MDVIEKYILFKKKYQIDFFNIFNDFDMLIKEI